VDTTWRVATLDGGQPGDGISFLDVDGGQPLPVSLVDECRAGLADEQASAWIVDLDLDR